jgi:UPF0755 protein
VSGYQDDFPGPGRTAGDHWGDDPDAPIGDDGYGGWFDTDPAPGYDDPVPGYDDPVRGYDDPAVGGGAGTPGRGGAHRQGRASGSHRRRPPADHSTYRRRRILAVLASLVVLVIIVALVGVVYANHQINPGGREGARVAVDIPAHASTGEIGTILGRAGVIHDGKLFRYYAKVTGAGDLLPGNYQLARNESYDDAINALQKGPVLIVDRLTIPEGFTLAQIAARVGALPGLHLSAAKFLAAGTTGQVKSPYEPAGSDNLEGLVFPATYQVRQGQVEADILQEMVDAFDTNATQLGLVAGAKKLGMTPYQVVTVASIVEREAKLAGDRGDVASAIYNRLAQGMTLGADSTQTYYLRLTDPTVVPTVAQLEQPSPYNTRLNTGLPPTPIANPGIPSLMAAINPPSTTYLYFVETNPDGKLSFASDATGFAQLQTECAAAHLC